MSRALRRQQQATPKEGGGGGRRGGFGPRTPRPTRGVKAPAPERKRRLRLGKPGWIEEIWSELKKVSWPSRDETLYLTMVVILVSLIVGSILGGIDIFFNWLIDRLLLR